MNKKPRLLFTAEEENAPAPKRPAGGTEVAKQRARQPQTGKPHKETNTQKSGKSGKKAAPLRFETTGQAPPSRLGRAVKNAPAELALGLTHRQIHQSEQENVGVESAHATGTALEKGARLVQEGIYSRRLKSGQPSARTKAAQGGAAPESMLQNSLADSAGFGSNPHSRRQQKWAIKRQYAAAKRSAKTGKQAKSKSEAAGKAARAAAEKAEQAAEFVWRHRRGFAILLLLLLMVSFLLNAFSSCSVMANSLGSMVSGSTYPSEEADMLAAEEAYAGMESELQQFLDNYESNHTYDEYHFQLDDIGHDPYVLISLLTASMGGEWTLREVQGHLTLLFGRQYTLTENVVEETRTRIETRIGYHEVTDPETGLPMEEEFQYEVEVEYPYTICTVTLENFDLSRLPAYLLTEDQLSLYSVYMATHGNRPDLFPVDAYPGAFTGQDYLDYEVPSQALGDDRFAAMLAEAEKYLGYPYVWGGSSPATSFDCSGFICWVLNHSGWSVGRRNANGLLNICTPVSAGNARPGDLIFFQGTYDTIGASHVGLYVGGGMMIHSGDPVSYANINTSYWQSHFLAFGRLP